MFVILTYDVNVKRVSKVMKICRKYLTHVQKSVFEGLITEGKYDRLRSELKKVADVETDSIKVYKITSTKFTTKEELGLVAKETNLL